jgi:hypothetical protein
MSQQIREIQEIGNNVIANTLANDWTFQIYIALIGGGFYLRLAQICRLPITLLAL